MTMLQEAITACDPEGHKPVSYFEQQQIVSEEELIRDVLTTIFVGLKQANLVLFTTGLGTPTGNPVAPVIKISSNSELARRMRDVIDFEAGPIIREEADIDKLADQLLSLCIDTASGRYATKAVRLSQLDFILWKRGVSL